MKSTLNILFDCRKELIESEDRATLQKIARIVGYSKISSRLPLDKDSIRKYIDLRIKKTGSDNKFFVEAWDFCVGVEAWMPIDTERMLTLVSGQDVCTLVDEIEQVIDGQEPVLGKCIDFVLRGARHAPDEALSFDALVNRGKSLFSTEPFSPKKRL